MFGVCEMRRYYLITTDTAPGYIGEYHGYTDAVLALAYAAGLFPAVGFVLIEVPA